MYELHVRTYTDLVHQHLVMPLEDTDEEQLPPTLLGRVVDTVNTARDIGHVIWNAAWSN
jgi:hypothetical protein